ncbi:cation:proton antiporter subunit C [Corynebacterium sp. 320]|uniref:sodium:proton antiporter n=1 Tax=Corynebacterium TaxID=1716 RepID=UPI00125CBE57|nr:MULTISPECIES: cation:proton antiporter subunit C [Corynebacterium]KAB1502868.1 cation:proton antiporter subunit C [Corynebacterium sp. 320]KAB1552379.1 cation:proton antiporter subunit C [Corynebacterium sp. 321]KAB1554406.1 cation:proton antiporter subunit C [Corynebacterium sp. 319]KAB3526531.1 cation:proton antiporter subunit C [Corynebacterium sp. 250]KAB3539851.1 cation:proton antiporter subunit C [Corynebacterium sp. 366]
MILALIIAILIGGGVYMVMQRGMLRIIIGIALLSHGVNLLILSTGIGAWRTEPLMDRATSGEAADPLPQAFVLTAIVISMASTAVLLAMAALGRDDDTRSSDDPESGFRRYRSFQTMGRGTQRAGVSERDLTRDKKQAESKVGNKAENKEDKKS